MSIQAVEAGGRSGGETFQLLNLLKKNLPIWHFQMLTGMCPSMPAWQIFC